MEKNIKKEKAMQSLFTLACSYYYTRVLDFDSLGTLDQEISIHLEILKIRDSIVQSAREFMEPADFLQFQRGLPWPSFKETYDNSYFLNQPNNQEGYSLMNGAN